MGSLAQGGRQVKIFFGIVSVYVGGFATGWIFGHKNGWNQAYNLFKENKANPFVDKGKS